MPTVLHIDVSPRGDQTVSRQVSAAAVSARPCFNRLRLRWAKSRERL